MDYFNRHKCITYGTQNIQDTDRLSEFSATAFLNEVRIQKAITNDNKGENRLSLASRDQTIKFVHQNSIGSTTTFRGPFGLRQYLYVDYTASGKPLGSIEQFIYHNVLPHYANTHTTTSHSSRQTTEFRNDARNIIKECVNASKEDEVIFCGSGTTAAVHKLIHSIQGVNQLPPIVFIGPYEHHSNILPWRNVASRVINIPETEYGEMDVKFLKSQLQKISSKECANRLIIGCFSAASNVTGALTDDVAVTILMHQYGGLGFWDYAAAAPHTNIDMNPSMGRRVAQKDAIYFSGHKFVGGPQTPGVLVAKRHLFRNASPHGCGGGTVFFVTPERHQYLNDLTEREEGGTPAIIESIRLGLVFLLQMTVGSSAIMEREAYFTKKALLRWTKVRGLNILGHNYKPRAPIISFMVEHINSGFYLHHNFIASLLNDLFGIQCRGGCMCAGPYSQILLQIDLNIAHKYEDILSRQRGSSDKPKFDVIFRPGFARVSFPYHATEEEVDFVIEAISFIAEEGWKFLPLYRFCPESGNFSCMLPQTSSTSSLRSFIHTIDVTTTSQQPEKRSNINDERSPTFSECLSDARMYSNKMALFFGNRKMRDDSLVFHPDIQKFRWFLLPSEALSYLQLKPRTTSLVKSPKPFTPNAVAYKKLKKSSRENCSEGSIPHEMMTRTCWSDAVYNDDERSSSSSFQTKLQYLFRNKKETFSLDKTRGLSHSSSDIKLSSNYYNDVDITKL